MVVFLAKAFGFIGNRIEKICGPFLKIRDKIIFGMIDKIVIGEPELKRLKRKLQNQLSGCTGRKGLIKNRLEIKIAL